MKADRIVRDPANRGVLEYAIHEADVYGHNYQKRAMMMVTARQDIGRFVRQVAGEIARTRPVVLPMTWSLYPERLWDESHSYVKPCLTIRPDLVDFSIDKTADATGRYPTRYLEIINAKATVNVTCEPCWEAWKRWSSVIIDDFHKGMDAVRDRWGLKWRDWSKTTSELKWENLEYRYKSQTPATVFSYPIAEVEEWGAKYNAQTVEVYVNFTLGVPRTPEEERLSGGCTTVEEEVTTTTTKTVVRVKCT